MSVMFGANFFIAVIVATIVSFAVGGIWYGPAFGKAWMAALGKTDADMETMRKRAPKGFAAGLVGAFIASFVLGLLIRKRRQRRWAAQGDRWRPHRRFPGLVRVPHDDRVSGAIFEGRPGRLVGINQGFWILSYLLMGAILGYWVWV